MDFLKQVEAAIRATTIHSTKTYSWFGQYSPRIHASLRGALTPHIERNYLLHNLKSQLYRDFYCPGFPVSAHVESGSNRSLGMTPFVRALSAANNGCGLYDDGWSVIGIKEENLVVRKAELELWTRRGDCRIASGIDVALGADLALGFPKELLGMSPGFYMALGDRQLTEADHQRLLRLYWNLTDEGALSFVHKATRRLNRADIPFRLKVVNDPTQFNRCDAVVLYIRKDDYARVSHILERIYTEVAGQLKARQPAFTKPLARGLGLAEDPGGGHSFGFHRSQLLAEGLVCAFERHARSLGARIEAVRESFAQNGIRLDVPYLTFSSDDAYEFRTSLPRRRPGSAANSPRTVSAATLLEAAAQIGQHLCHRAIWHERHCNWLGNAEDEPERARGRPIVQKYSALGPDLYSGTSGIGLFLAQLYSETGDAEIGRAALGATRHALSRSSEMKPANRRGLYTGWLGVALAAARVGSLLGEDALREDAAVLIGNLPSAKKGNSQLDLFSGSAGAILALLGLGKLGNHDWLLGLAVQFGDELLLAADKTSFGYSWKSRFNNQQRNLTGFAHGTAGIGLALMELSRATGNDDYRQGAEQAFAYERHWFDLAARKSPDFSGERGAFTRFIHASGFGNSWRSGAPGIALSRLRAYQLTEDVTCRTEALAGLDSTRQTARESLQFGAQDYSPCHGLTGQAEILAYGQQVLGQDCDDGHALALACASLTIQVHSKHKRAVTWETGGPDTPGLMTGLAGIGYCYLRLRDPATPSILLPLA